MRHYDFSCSTEGHSLALMPASAMNHAENDGHRFRVAGTASPVPAPSDVLTSKDGSLFVFVSVYKADKDDFFAVVERLPTIGA